MLPTLKMEAVRSSETLVPTYHTIHCIIIRKSTLWVFRTVKTLHLISYNSWPFSHLTRSQIASVIKSASLNNLISYRATVTLTCFTLEHQFKNWWAPPLRGVRGSRRGTPWEKSVNFLKSDSVEILNNFTRFRHLFRKYPSELLIQIL
jgi:hypothetical protein